MNTVRQFILFSDVNDSLDEILKKKILILRVDNYDN